MLVAGVDEAGRGPCVGPMVLAVATIDSESETELFARGIKDSKLLSPSKRDELFPVVHDLCSEVAFECIEAEELDQLMSSKSLNEIEAMRIGKLLNALNTKPDVVYVDSPDVISSNFAERIKKYISFKPKIVAEHKADVNYAITGAASIVAKVNRDRRISELAKIYGNIGSGYASDESTINFIKRFLYDNNVLPPFVRKKWLTTERILNEKYQKKLFTGGAAPT